MNSGGGVYVRIHKSVIFYQNHLRDPNPMSQLQQNKFVHFHTGQAPAMLIKGYVDSDWRTPRSTTGFAFFINDGIVSWKSSRQKLASLSATEAEWYGAADACKEALHLRDLLAFLGSAQPDPTPLHEDNAGCVQWCTRLGHHARRKHVELQSYFACDAVAQGVVKMIQIPSADNVSDFFTKVMQSAAEFTRQAQRPCTCLMPHLRPN